MASQLHADVRKLKAYSAVEQFLYKNEEVTELKRLVIVRAFYQCIRSNVLECSVFGVLGIGATLVSMAIAVHFRLSSFIAATGLISYAVAKGIQALRLYFGLRKQRSNYGHIDHYQRSLWRAMISILLLQQYAAHQGIEGRRSD